MDPVNGPLFTCLSCSIAFASAEDQRAHYRSDYHRYNMKRRVASLPPVSATVFNQKVLERRQETAVISSPRGSSCEVCGKTYTTENAYRSHINSKKHKENEIKAASQLRNAQSHHVDNDDFYEPPLNPPQPPTPELRSKRGSDDETNRTIDAKIAAARSKLSTSSCLFCTHSSSCLEDNLSHMSSSHSFFVPDAEYLVDITGLSVRKHMIDKGHCKIAYDTESDKLEVSDYYDFTTSYPTEASRRKKETKLADDEDWEDVEDDSCSSEDLDEVDDPSASESDDSESLPDNQLTYGDTEYELVLPSGARIGHRSMKRYYSQSLHSIHVKEEDPNTGAALVRRLLADKNSALVPRKGGFGAFGLGTEAVKARNKGEAREAGRHVREFRDQRRREDFKTKVAFIHNSQKHFRDPLLQVSHSASMRAPYVRFRFYPSMSRVVYPLSVDSQTYRAGSGTIVYQVDLDK
ncbi:hypothetical protein BU15DRAFT_90724 [Melanogaster broomeanus]|nr:hypothetical protein BU15DRAFT_90724 [Melanogaster broomeanus]